MTTATVSEYADLVGDQVSSSAEKDVILMLLRGESDAVRVFRGESWVWDEKSLETHPSHETLVAGRVIAETQKGMLVTQLGDAYQDEDITADDPQTDWIPKSVVREYRPDPEQGVTNTSPQKFIGDYE